MKYIEKILEGANTTYREKLSHVLWKNACPCWFGKKKDADCDNVGCSDCWYLPADFENYPFIDTVLSNPEAHRQYLIACIIRHTSPCEFGFECKLHGVESCTQGNCWGIDPEAYTYHNDEGGDKK